MNLLIEPWMWSESIFCIFSINFNSSVHPANGGWVLPPPPLSFLKKKKNVLKQNVENKWETFIWNLRIWTNVTSHLKKRWGQYQNKSIQCILFKQEIRTNRYNKKNLCNFYWCLCLVCFFNRKKNKTRFRKSELCSPVIQTDQTDIIKYSEFKIFTSLCQEDCQYLF